MENIACSWTTLKRAIFLVCCCCVAFHKPTLQNVANSFSPPAQTIKYHLLQPVSKAAFVNNKMLVWNSSNADLCALTLANIFYATEIKKGRNGWENWRRQYIKWVGKTTQNLLEFYLIAQLQSLFLLLLSYFSILISTVLFGETRPLLTAYRIWDVLPSLRNRYVESIRALQVCDRITPTPAAPMSKRMALWKWVLLTLPRSDPGQITLTVEWHKRPLTL